MKRLIIIILILLVGCQQQLCDYSKECVPDYMDDVQALCCSEVGLVKMEMPPFEFNFTNMCCFPSNCLQSRYNPFPCICNYNVNCSD